MPLGRRKNDDSDDDDTPKKPTAAGKESGAEEGGALQRRAGGKGRFGGGKGLSDDSDDEDAAEKRKAAAAEKKAKQEALKAAIQAKKEKAEQDEIEAAAKGGDEDEGAAGVGGGDETQDGGALRRKRGEDERTRFGGTTARSNGSDDAPTGSLLMRQPSCIPWHGPAPWLGHTEGENRVYMTLRAAKTNERTMAKVREQMRKQGLYVARERVLLPKNVERAIQRVRARKEHSKQSAPKDDNAEAAAVSASVNEPNEFSKDEERYLVPFDPLKERYCRPATRYDPYLPYLQYKMLVPVTNVDAVFGTSDPSTLLEIDIRRLTLTDHPYFSQEDFRAAELELLWRKYKQRTEINWVELYTQKIEDLKSALDTVVKERELGGGDGAGASAAPRKDGDPGVQEEGGEALLQKEAALHQELGELRLKRAAEEFEDLSIVSSMIQLWEKIKTLRKDNEFVSTRVDLKFRKKSMDKRQDENNRAEELEAELAELTRQHNHAFAVKQMAWLERKDRLEKEAQQRGNRARLLEQRIADANMAEASDEDASTEDDEDGDGPEAKPGATSNRDDRMTIKLQADLLHENNALDKVKDLLKDLAENEPKLDDDPFDQESHRREIVERQEKTKRPPGTPLYIPVLSHSKSPTESDSLPTGKTDKGGRGEAERKRRERVRNLKLLMRISVNGHYLPDETGAVKEVVLTQRPGHDFSFTVDETIKLAATSGDPQIKLHICERSLVSVRELATLFVPIADSNDDRGDPYRFQEGNQEDKGPDGFVPNWYKDITDKQGKTYDKGKSDYNIFGGFWGKKEDKMEPSGLHYIQGEVTMKVNKLPALQNDDGTVSVAVDPAADDPVDSRSSSGAMKGSLMSVPKLKSMIQQNRLDPNDPKNRHLLGLLCKCEYLLAANKERDSEGFVRFDTMADMLKLTGDSKDETIKIKPKDREVMGQRWIGSQDLTRPANPRQKLLLSRQANPALFSTVGWHPVPLIENEIEEDDILDKVYSIEFPDTDMSGATVDDKKVQKVMKFKQKVQEQVRKAKAKHGAKVKRVFRLEDIVHQPELPLFGGGDILLFFTRLLRKRTALRPEVNPARATVTNPSTCYISVTVQRAHNLPRRRPPEGAPPGSDHKANQLEVQVEARFGQETAKTPIAKGNEPAWNTRLRLRFEAPGNNWSPSNLLQVQDKLYLTVFDTKTMEKSEGAGTMMKVERHWLGSVEFPFTTLYSAKSRIDGVFKINAPPHVIGYSSAPQEKKGRDGTALPKLPSLQVCVSLDPPLVQPGDGSGDEARRLDGQGPLEPLINDWIRYCSKPMHCRGRSYDALGRSLHRDWVLATRFVTPEDPPAKAYDTQLPLEKQMAQLARFVGLIPFLDDFQLDGGADGADVDPDSLDVWCTSAEFIDIMAGDWEEHATLLCNFFKSILKAKNSNMQAYLVFGRGIPEGDTVYTMTITPSSDSLDGKPKVDFWNASVGSVYSQRDPHCTLKEVFYVVDDKNIWGNVQAANDIRNTNFDLTNKKDWWPLFTPEWEEKHDGKFQKETVQDKVDWRPGQKHEAYEGEITKFVRDMIRTRFESWRNDRGLTTTENMSLNKSLAAILKRMEQAQHFEGEFTEDNLHTELDKYMKQNDLTGFYINRPYTDIEPIIEEIQNADIHNCGPISDGNDRDTQFAIAVYAKAFPRRVLSLWVAVACCSKRQRK